jgi:hypothetical protein
LSSNLLSAFALLSFTDEGAPIDHAGGAFEHSRSHQWSAGRRCRSTNRSTVRAEQRSGLLGIVCARAGSRGRLSTEHVEPSGLDGLLGALGGGQHQRYVDDAAALGHPDTIDDGNGILGHIFGSKDVSRQVATHAAAQTGVGADVLKSMLPVVAAMMMGTMSKKLSQPSSANSGGDALLGMLAPVLSSNSSGSMVDSVAGLVGRLFASR